MTIWVGTSWKMTKSRAEARDYATTLRDAATTGWPGVQPFVIPPVTALAEVAAVLAGSSVIVGAQNVHWEPAGAWTGEVSVPQVKDAGATLVEIGHSERREHFGETDRTVNLKVRAALANHVTPLVCVGEPAAVFERGESAAHVLAQVAAALAGIADARRVLLAYEPIWAIGDGGRPARPDEVAGVFEVLRREYGGRVTAVLYGGSVSADNAAVLLQVPGVGGLFVGRAAWDVHGYLDILRLACRWPRPEPTRHSYAVGTATSRPRIATEVPNT